MLDPACGCGNFLYVTLEHMKRLEGEVLDLRRILVKASNASKPKGLTVDPHQFLGLEINPRAAAIAELVLWIGYLQWHFRTRGAGLPPSPILHNFHNIECRDAVLAYDAANSSSTPTASPSPAGTAAPPRRTRSPAKTCPTKPPACRSGRYSNPRQAELAGRGLHRRQPAVHRQQANARCARRRLRRSPARHLAGGAGIGDFVMYWWHIAARTGRRRAGRRFGFITTNSLTQTFNRRVVQGAFEQGVYLAFAIPDHPWVDSADGAAVRIAMTVGSALKNGPGMLSDRGGRARQRRRRAGG